MSRLQKPYWEYLDEHIFIPAGMHSIRINTEKDIVPNKAKVASYQKRATSMLAMLRQLPIQLQTDHVIKLEDLLA